MKLTLETQKPVFVCAGLVVLALGLRLAVMLVTSGAAYDITSYHLQAEAVFEHRNIYLFTDRYPYPPVWVWLVSLAQGAANVTHLPFDWFAKVPGIIGDCLIIALLWRRAGSGAALFYACNPVSLLITAGHGQFDGLVMALAVAAWVLATGKHRYASYWAALALGVAIALKGYPLLFLPPLILAARSLRQRVIVTGLAALPLVVALVIYSSLFGWTQAMFLRVTGYSSYPYFGWALYVDVLLRDFLPLASYKAVEAVLSLIARAALVIVVGWLVWRGRSWPLERLWLALVLAVYALAPGIAVQYFLWALPLLALVDRKRGVLYTLLSFVAMVLFYLTQEPGAVPGGMSVSQDVPSFVWLAGYVLIDLPWWLMCLWLLRVVVRDAGKPVMAGAGEKTFVTASSA